MRGTIRKFSPAIVSGVLLASCFPRFQLFFLAWFALVPLLWRARVLPPIHAALHFFFAGFVFHVILLQWLLANIMWAGGWAVLGQQMMCVVLSLFWAVAGLLWRWLGARNSRLGGPLTFALLWVAMEHAQATLFTGFGWSSLAYSQGPDLYLLQWAAIGTGLAISFMIALVNALLIETIATPSRGPLYAAAALVVIAAAHGAGFLLLEPATPASDPLKIGLFQSNYSLEMKWDPEYRYEAIRNASEKSIALAARHDLDLMVWPEALILADIDAPEVRDLLARTTRDGRFMLFAGAGRTEGQRDYNSALLINESGDIVAWYDKLHLAPFGEYVPLSKYLPFITKLVPTIGDLSAGTKPRVMQVDGRALGPLICFEVLFSPMSNRLRRDGADVLVVATNLAWFGHSTAIPQELEIARVRAVETRLPLIHAANTGIAGVFDPYGRFTPVNLWAASGSRLYPLAEDTPLDALIMQRLVGAFDLPAAAPQPLLTLHRFLPWTVDALCAALLLLALVLPRDDASGRSRRE
jgi:apolipoprotein N-acyltransferase